MNFRTQIPICKQSDNLIDYHSRLLLLGSCFSENIGGKLSYFKFQSEINPFGILFHPKAIETFLDRVTHKKLYTEDELVFHNEQYHCFDAHSCLSNANKNSLLNNLNSIIELTAKKISEATHVIITLGTAWVYEYNNTGKIVANCHKIPQKQFNKQLLSVDQIKNSLINIEQQIRSINPKAQLIYTVSPVRHIKDGFVQNQQSKAHLLTAIHQVTNSTNECYFPSYEIMMDELRDYRFYKEDMIHPNQVAVNYIWERFAGVWISKSALDTMKDVEVVQKGLAHKPFNPNSEQYLKFVEQLEVKKKRLREKYPFIFF